MAAAHVAAAGEGEAAGDAGGDAVEVAGPVVVVDLVGLGERVVDRAVGGVGQGQRRVQVRVDRRAAAAAASELEHGDGAVDVAGLEAVQAHRRRCARCRRR